jgi:hypothetical protein
MAILNKNVFFQKQNKKVKQSCPVLWLHQWVGGGYKDKVKKGEYGGNM